MSSDSWLDPQQGVNGTACDLFHHPMRNILLLDATLKNSENFSREELRILKHFSSVSGWE
jgi:hypothetical protein